MVDATINYLADIVNRRSPSDPNNTKERVLAHFVVSDGGYVFTSLTCLTSAPMGQIEVIA